MNSPSQPKWKMPGGGGRPMGPGFPGQELRSGPAQWGPPKAAPDMSAIQNAGLPGGAQMGMPAPGPQTAPPPQGGGVPAMMPRSTPGMGPAGAPPQPASAQMQMMNYGPFAKNARLPWQSGQGGSSPGAYPNQWL